MAPILAYDTVKLRAQEPITGATRLEYDAIVREELTAALANHSEQEIYRDVVRSWLRAQPFSEEWEFYRVIKRGFDSYTLGLAGRKPFSPPRPSTITTSNAFRRPASSDVPTPATPRALRSSLESDPLFEAIAAWSREVRELSSNAKAAIRSTRIKAKAAYVAGNRAQKTPEETADDGKQGRGTDLAVSCPKQDVEDDFVVVDSRASSPELYISDDDEVVCVFTSPAKD